MTSRPIFDFERTGMFGALLWLKTYEDEPDKLFSKAFITGTGAHWEALPRIRDHLGAYGLLKTEGEAHKGQGSRVSYKLTPRGKKAHAIVERMDAVLRKSMPKSRDPTPAPAVLHPDEHPVLHTERGGVWRVLIHLEKFADDPEMRFRRNIEYHAPVAPHTFTAVRDILFALNVIDEHGAAAGGRGARLTYNLNKHGLEVARLGLELEGTLKRVAPVSKK